MNYLSVSDISVLGLYLVLVLSVGIFYALRRHDTAADYFLAGRNTGWIAIGISLFATNISSEHLIGLAGYGASRGLAIGNFEWMAILFIMMLGWFIAPILLKSKVFTVPEFLGKRFDQRVRFLLSTISIVAYVLTKISITLYAGGILFETAFGLDMYTSSVIMVVLTGIYTISGGMRSVINTSVIQGVFLIAGATVFTLFGLHEAGGWSGLHQLLPDSFFTLFKGFNDPELPWTGMVFGAPILAIWYWCTDQYIVQRVLSARSVDDARRGTILTGFLKISPVFLLVVPGLVAAALYPGIKGDNAFAALFMADFMPAGIRGLVLSGLIAALMSSLASCFNSTATLFTMDFYRHFKPTASQHKLVLIGRLSTTAIVVSAILWIPLTKFISTHLYVHLQSVQAFIGPPVAAVFLLGIIWPFASARGAFIGLLAGEVLGGLRLFYEIFKVESWQFPLFSMNFLHFAIFSFVITLALVSLVSLIEKRLEQDGISYSTGMIISPRLALTAAKNNEVVISILLVLTLIGLWGNFVW